MRAVALVAVCGCSSIYGLESPTRLDASGAIDEQVLDVYDAAPGSWYDIQRAFPSTVADDDPSLTRDELEMYFDRGSDIYLVRRATMADAWSLPAKVVELSSPEVDSSPEIYLNNVVITFASTRSSSVNGDVWASVRQASSDPWMTPARFTTINSPANDSPGPFSDDGLVLALSSERNAGAGHDLFLSPRGSQVGEYGTPVAINELNTPASEHAPFLTGDGNTLYFSSDRDGDEDLYVSTRQNGVWSEPVQLVGLSTAGVDADPWVSNDGKRIYFASDRDGTMGIWTARRD